MIWPPTRTVRASYDADLRRRNHPDRSRGIGELDLLTAFAGQIVVDPAVRSEVTTQPAAANLDRFCDRDDIETAVLTDEPSMDGDVQRARTILAEQDSNGDVRLIAAALANIDAGE